MASIEKMGKITNYFLSWSAISKIYSGIIGKSIFIISLAVPLSKLIKTGLDLAGYSYSLAGAVLIALGYIYQTALLPEIVSEYKTANKYSSYLSERNAEESLDWVSEFKGIDELKNSTIPDYLLKDISSILDFLPVAEGKDMLSEKRAIYVYGPAKFYISNKMYPLSRGTITILLIVGLFLLYLPTVEAIYIVLGR